MPLKVRPYLSTDFNAWLDLTAISSVELNEEFLIWNDRPFLPPQSYSFLLATEQQLIASADLIYTDNRDALLVKHWAVRKSNCKHEFYQFLNEIMQLTNSTIRVWIASPELVRYFLEKPMTKIVENRVTFFVKGSFSPELSQNRGFCDHIFGTCPQENFKEIADNLPIANNEFMAPKFQSCLEISLS